MALSPQGQPLTEASFIPYSERKPYCSCRPKWLGKTSLINVLLGFLPYEGSKINGVELNQSRLSDWRKQIAWVGQNPLLLVASKKIYF